MPVTDTYEMGVSSPPTAVTTEVCCVLKLYWESKVGVSIADSFKMAGEERDVI